jgi:predicted dehydrogenase
MLKVAIAGCGKIADDHAALIQRIAGCEIVGAFDREPLMAQQLFERFPIRRHFSDLSELLSEARPDVVHITTPPESHFELAKLCLESGSHVYVEKPFTLFETDARTLIALADETGLKITVGHDAQFGPAARRMRTLVQNGYLGDGPVHIESYYGYELGEGYARAVLADAGHWVRRLPGQLLQNVISHGIARISELLTTDSPQVMAYGFTSPFLKRIGETGIIDELRVIIGDGERTTAYFTFSSQMRPSIHECRIYGSTNGLVLNSDHETVLKLRGAKFTSYADKFIPPVSLASQYVSNVLTNMRSFLRSDFHMKSGMKFLIEHFYRSIVEDTPVPIPYREILLTAKIMDAIFAQLDSARDIQSPVLTTAGPQAALARGLGT